MGIYSLNFPVGSQALANLNEKELDQMVELFKIL